MKTFILSAFALSALVSTNAYAHNAHSSNHSHAPHTYNYQSDDHHYNHHTAHRGNDCHGSSCGRLTTNTATYYSRSYPVTNTYSYYTTPNTTIHQPPFAYSSCAHNCDDPKRIMVTSKLGSRNYTYRAPSEYNASHRYVNTPRKITNCNKARSTSYVSPYRTHKLTTCTSFGCSY